MRVISWVEPASPPRCVEILDTSMEMTCETESWALQGIRRGQPVAVSRGCAFPVGTSNHLSILDSRVPGFKYKPCGITDCDSVTFTRTMSDNQPDRGHSS